MHLPVDLSQLGVEVINGFVDEFLDVALFFSG
jgi:hypothetical protein